VGKIESGVDREWWDAMGGGICSGREG